MNIIAILMGSLALFAAASSTQPTASAKARAPVLVELFTSEGCSSCPPADELLAKLAKQPIDGALIIPLSFHVDYWNNLGWRDAFSSPEFTRRQQDYASTLHLRSIYTPQMIVDGRDEFVGSDEREASSAIARAATRAMPRIAVQLTSARDANRCQVELTLPSTIKLDRTTDVLLAITEDDLSSNVARGENAGRKLNHVAVVRQLVTLAPDRAGALKTTVAFDPQWNRAHLHIVAFVQIHESRQILAAGIEDAAQLAEK